jgi:uncharacterized protein (DUF1810 family)
MAQPEGLDRFIDAQRAVYDDVVRELRTGRKLTHWMWFIFPQIAGLGRSATAQRYAIESIDEARDYLRHPVLGPRLRECTSILLEAEERTAEQVLGVVDAMKLRSSMTLFHRAAPADPLFSAALDQFFGGQPDPETDERLSGAAEE